MGKRPSARVVAVGGGKGGVGKSIVAGNLAIAMAESGFRVVLVDADLGGANQHTLFGLEAPRTSLQTLLEHEVDTLEAATTPTSVRGLRLVAGMGAIAGAANINHGQKQKLLRHIRALDTDVVVIDVGAGISYNVLDFYDLAHQRLVVMTPQLTSLQNAYAFAKGAVLRSIRHTAANADEVALLEASTSARETARVSALVDNVRAASGRYASAIEGLLTRFGAWIVGNQVFEPRDLGVFHAVSRMMQDFLSVSAPVLGHLRASRRIHDSVTRRRPFLLDGAGDENAQAFRRMAEALLLADIEHEQAPVPLERPTPPPAPPVGDDEPLPAEPAIYMRRHERHSVKWSARLESSRGQAVVRVREVSLGGAGIEVVQALLRSDDRCTLVFHELPDSPVLPAIVRRVDPRSGHVGLEFQCDASEVESIVEAARGEASALAARPSTG